MKKIERVVKSAGLAIVRLIFGRRRREMISLDLAIIHKVLIYRPERIGDLFISFPLIGALQAAKPDLRFDAVVSPVGRSLAETEPALHKLYIYQKSFFHDLRTALAVRREKYDLIIDLVGSDSVTAAISVIFFARRRAFTVAVGKSRLASYYDCNFGIFGDRHMIDSMVQPLALFGIQRDRVRHLVPPYITERARRTAGEFIHSLNLKNGDIAVGINISAGNAGRIWSDNNYLTLLAQLNERHGDWRLVLVATPEDRERAEKLWRAAGGVASLVPDKLHLNEVAAILMKLRLFISPDTSLVHIARSFGIPVVALFVPAQENYKRWGPYGQRRGVLVSPDRNSINAISPEAVLAEIEAIQGEGRE